MSVHCEIIEVSHVEDATGYPCGQDASARCRDCGTPICDTHGEACAGCGVVFCATCLAFHFREQHQKKAARAAERQRKSA